MWQDSESCLQVHFVQSDGMEPKKVPCGTSAMLTAIPETLLPSWMCCVDCDLGSKEVIYSHPSNLGVRGKHNPPITTVPGLLKWDVEHVRDCSIHTSVFLVNHSRVFIMCKWRSLVSSRLAHQGTQFKTWCFPQNWDNPHLKTKGEDPLEKFIHFACTILKRSRTFIIWAAASQCMSSLHLLWGTGEWEKLQLQWYEREWVRLYSLGHCRHLLQFQTFWRNGLAHWPCPSLTVAQLFFL